MSFIARMKLKGSFFLIALSLLSLTFFVLLAVFLLFKEGFVTSRCSNVTSSVTYCGCSTDSDCVVAPVRDCACSGYGNNMSINKDFKEQWFRENNEESFAWCLSAVKENMNCLSSPKCSDGQCVLFFNKEDVCDEIKERCETVNFGDGLFVSCLTCGIYIFFH